MDSEHAAFVVHALHGPPRPVLVLSVHGEVDRTNDAELIARVRRTVEEARSAPAGRAHAAYGSRTLAHAVVVDLRAVTFIGARALGLLAFQRDAAGERVRIVVPRDGVIRRALAVVQAPAACRLYADVADAVLSEVDPTEHVTD